MKMGLIIGAVIMVLFVIVVVKVSLDSSSLKEGAESNTTSYGGKPGETDQTLEMARKLQTNYWSLDADELFRLRSRSLGDLTWEQRFRLLHLVCLEMLSQDSVKKQLMGVQPIPQKAPGGASQQLIVELIRMLLSKKSPYRSGHIAVWQGVPGESGNRGPDLEGELRNASLTHLGCLEVLRLDKDQKPTELCFVPFDRLRGVIFSGQALFRYAKLFYDDGREDEIVMVPLLYGISWHTLNQSDHDGTLTRFLCGMTVEEKEMTFSIGVGHQDFLIRGEKQDTLFGLGSVGEFMVALATDDPRFEEKCRARGLDPEEVKDDLSKKEKKEID